MSKVTIPRPVAVLWKEERPYQEPLTRLELWPPFEPLEIFDPLITTTQAEAYADAKVREALEQAAQIAEGEEFQDEHGRPSRKGRTWGTWHEESPVGGVTRAIAGAIRALIPKEAKS